MAKLENQDEVIAQTSRAGITVQLIEHKDMGCFLRWLGPGGVVISQSPPLCSDNASLVEARELFPDHLPWSAIAVDGNL